MSIAQTQLTGPIYMPNGVAPTEGQVFFELSSWDKQEGEAIFVSGPYSAPIDENGQFTVNLFTTTEGENQVVYKMSVHYLDQDNNKKQEYIGYFALVGEGPFSVHDLTIESELIPSTFDVLAEIQAYKSTIEGYYESFEDIDDYIAQINTNTADIETLTDSQTAGIITYQTKALMDADLNHDAGATAHIREDGDNNGIYRKVGASSSGSWTKIDDLPEETIGLTLAESFKSDLIESPIISANQYGFIGQGAGINEVNNSIDFPGDDDGTSGGTYQGYHFSPTQLVEGDIISLRVRELSGDASVLSRVRVQTQTDVPANIDIIDLVWDDSKSEWKYDDYKITADFDRIFWDIRHNGSNTSAVSTYIPEIIVGHFNERRDINDLDFANRLELQRVADSVENQFSNFSWDNGNVNAANPVSNESGDGVSQPRTSNGQTLNQFNGTLALSPSAQIGEILTFSARVSHYLGGSFPAAKNFWMRLTHDDDSQTELTAPLWHNEKDVLFTAKLTAPVKTVEIRANLNGPVATDETFTLERAFFSIGDAVIYRSQFEPDPFTQSEFIKDRTRLTNIETINEQALIDRFDLRARIGGTKHGSGFPDMSAIAAGAMARAYNAPNQYYVDSLLGDDSTGDGSKATPWATTDKAKAELGNVDDTTIFVRTPHTEQDRFQIGAKSNLIAYGGEGEAITYDARMDLSGATWTLDSGDVWTTQVSFQSAPTTNILNPESSDPANTYHAAMWLGDDWINWEVDGATIADNIAAIEAADSGFTLHFLGSTEPDLRNDEANTRVEVVVYAKMPDGTDPNGLDLKMTDHLTPEFNQATGDCVTNGVSIIGIYGKDAFSSAPDDKTGRVEVPTHINMEFKDVPIHGPVGPCHTIGFRAKGRPPVFNVRQGLPWAGGGGLHLYYADDNDAVDDDIDEILRHSLVDVHGFQHLVYCHGSGGGAGRIKGVSIEELRAQYGGSVVNFGDMVRETTIHRLHAENVMGGFGCLDLEVNGGRFETIAHSGGIGRNRSLTNVFDTAKPTTQIFRNLMMKNHLGPNDVSGAYAALVLAKTAPSGQLHEVIFDNCWDMSDTDRPFGFLVAGDNGAPLVKLTDLYLTNGTRFQDLKPWGLESAHGVPARITVEAGCSVGYGDVSTVSELEAALQAQGCSTFISSDAIVAPART